MQQQQQEEKQKRHDTPTPYKQPQNHEEDCVPKDDSPLTPDQSPKKGGYLYMQKKIQGLPRNSHERKGKKKENKSRKRERTVVLESDKSRNE
jgi:hypothetical protein